MNLNKTLKKLEQELKIIFPKISPEHDVYHLKRVCNSALKIQKKEGGDRFAIEVASYLHDVHRLMRKPGKKYVSPKESLPLIKKILKRAGVPPAKWSKILNCIRHHEDYSFSKKGKKSKDLETQIIQDADNLDSVGAISIARTYVWGGVHHIPIYDPTVPLKRKYYDEEDEVDASQMHHFYAKILRLKDDMNTKTAKKMAIPRHKFVLKYLDQFFKEWQGKV